MVRNDALVLMAASRAVPGLATYCDKHVKRNPDLLEAAEQWEARHVPALRKIGAVLAASGGVRDEVQQAAEQATFEAIRQRIRAQRDKTGYCEMLGEVITRGGLDLDKRRRTAPLLTRVMKFKMK